ncbi:hypothetical protein PUN28_007943 [Cardiocondyla obscurior]|uniref:Uncharacterized protein n=1 Tax=Cardiocondyla obscurior TaxID=286306 RepID=A0AAW2FYP5_9HYME
MHFDFPHTRHARCAPPISLPAINQVTITVLSGGTLSSSLRYEREKESAREMNKYSQITLVLR